MVLTGRCLCGAVAYTVDGPLRDVVDCHCVRCRRFTGHHMAATNAAAADIALAASDTLAWFPPADGGGVEYGFCRACGSSPFWRRAADAARWSLAAGTLEPPTGLRTTSAWWVRDAGDYFERPRRDVEFDGDGDRVAASGGGTT